jgi:hypothetical protein
MLFVHNKLLKHQLTESRLKCDLLEQSLRVLAQENHDMEVNKLKLPINDERGHSNINDQQRAINSNINNLNEDDNDSYEEFFDIRNFNTLICEFHNLMD